MEGVGVMTDQPRTDDKPCLNPDYCGTGDEDTICDNCALEMTRRQRAKPRTDSDVVTECKHGTPVCEPCQWCDERSPRTDDGKADEYAPSVSALINWTRTQRFGDQGLRLRVEQVGNALETQQARVQELERECRIRDLAVPLEEDLSARIDEALKYLAMEQGFTLAGLARLFVEVQKRMAADWLEVGGLRRKINELEREVARLKQEARDDQTRENFPHRGLYEK